MSLSLAGGPRGGLHARGLSLRNASMQFELTAF